MIAAAGVGALQSVRDAIAMITYSRELTPDAANTARYRDLIAQRLEMISGA